MKTFNFARRCAILFVCAALLAGCGTRVRALRPAFCGISALDRQSADFSLGYHSGTSWSPGGVRLTNPGGQPQGSFRSRLFDAGCPQNWEMIQWKPAFPSLKELPADGAAESGYATGGMDMSGNAWLLHFGETTGATSFADSSGAGNLSIAEGTAGNASLVAGAEGRFGRGIALNGNNWISTSATDAINSSVTADSTFSV